MIVLHGCSSETSILPPLCPYSLQLGSASYLPSRATCTEDWWSHTSLSTRHRARSALHTSGSTFQFKSEFFSFYKSAWFAIHLRWRQTTTDKYLSDVDGYLSPYPTIGTAVPHLGTSTQNGWFESQPTDTIVRANSASTGVHTHLHLLHTARNLGNTPILA